MRDQIRAIHNERVALQTERDRLQWGRDSKRLLEIYHMDTILKDRYIKACQMYFQTHP